MATPPKDLTGQELKPKIVQQRTFRLLILVLILGVVAFGLKFYFENKNDPDFGSVKTAGDIAAIEYLPEGQRVVVFDPKGNKITSEGYREGSTERDLVWRPDGNRLFFVADRKEGEGFQVYRWKPTPNTEPIVRTQGSLGKSNLSFAADASKSPDEPLLLTSGGFVIQYDAKDQKGHQILPPTGGVTQASDNGEGQGSGTDQFTALYGQLGESFRMARWCHGTDAVAAVMRGEAGETLILQQLSPVNGVVPPPQLVTRGEHIDFDVNPSDGSVIYSVSRYAWRANDKTPKDQRYRHAVGRVAVGDAAPTILAASPKDDVSFSTPVISPTGDRLLILVGKYDSSAGATIPMGMRVAPTRLDGFQASALVVQGTVYEPSWSPDGKKVTYVKRNSAGKRAIFVANIDGSDEHAVSGADGNFGSPKFSPQTE